MADHDHAGGRSATPLRILFVCTANMARSPFAELLTTHWDPPGIAASSAGTHARAGAPLDPPMAEELQRHGAGSGATFRSRRLDAGVLDGADAVLTMQAWHRELILVDRPRLVARVFTLGQLVRSLAGIEPDVRGRAALDAAARGRCHAAETDDVPDPHGLGQAAATAVADRIEEHLRRLLRFLSAPDLADARMQG